MKGNEYMDISFPDKMILEITFFDKTDFYSLSFENQQYRIIGRDEGIKTILIGIGEDEKVYYIITDEKTLCYIAINTETFVKELLLFDHYMNVEGSHLPENPDDAQLSAFTDNFKAQILKLDADAFHHHDTFWSEICEEMEYGVII